MTGAEPPWMQNVKRQMRERQRREWDRQANADAVAFVGIVLLLTMWAFTGFWIP